MTADNKNYSIFSKNSKAGFSKKFVFDHFLKWIENKIEKEYKEYCTKNLVHGSGIKNFIQ